MMAYLKDRVLMIRIVRVILASLSIVIFAGSFFAAIAGQYDKAAFFVLLAIVTAPHIWLSEWPTLPKHYE